MRRGGEGEGEEAKDEENSLRNLHRLQDDRCEFKKLWRKELTFDQHWSGLMTDVILKLKTNWLLTNTDQGCGKCSTCLKDYPHLCAARRCSEPIFTEIAERVNPIHIGFIHLQLICLLWQPKSESRSSGSIGRRCQECDGCKADPCGTCNACLKTPDLCKARECTNRLVRGQKNLHGVAPIVQNHQESSVKKGHNPRRYKRCNECDGCKVE